VKLKDVIFMKKFLQINTRENEFNMLKSQLSTLIKIPRKEILLGKEKEI
jgi:hypothetical protein